MVARTLRITDERFRDRDWRCVDGAAGAGRRDHVPDDFVPLHFAGWAPDQRPQRDTAFRLRVRGRTLRAVTPAPYAGACTTRLRDRTIRWDGTRFRSRQGRPYRVRRSGC